MRGLKSSVVKKESSAGGGGGGAIDLLSAYKSVRDGLKKLGYLSTPFDADLKQLLNCKLDCKTACSAVFTGSAAIGRCSDDCLPQCKAGVKVEEWVSEALEASRIPLITAPPLQQQAHDNYDAADNTRTQIIREQEIVEQQQQQQPYQPMDKRRTIISELVENDRVDVDKYTVDSRPRITTSIVKEVVESNERSKYEGRPMERERERGGSDRYERPAPAHVSSQTTVVKEIVESTNSNYNNNNNEQQRFNGKYERPRVNMVREDDYVESRSPPPPPPPPHVSSQTTVVKEIVESSNAYNPRIGKYDNNNNNNINYERERINEILESNDRAAYQGSSSKYDRQPSVTMVREAEIVESSNAYNPRIVKYDNNNNYERERIKEILESNDRVAYQGSSKYDRQPSVTVVREAEIVESTSKYERAPKAILVKEQTTELIENDRGADKYDRPRTVVVKETELIERERDRQRSKYDRYQPTPSIDTLIKEAEFVERSWPRPPAVKYGRQPTEAARFDVVILEEVNYAVEQAERRMGRPDFVDTKDPRIVKNFYLIFK